MSLKAIKDVLDAVKHWKCTDRATNAPCAHCRRLDALKEIAALEKAAKDLTRLHLSDGADDVAHREHVIQAMTDDPASQWNHPDVQAWAEASLLLATIAKEAP